MSSHTLIFDAPLGWQIGLPLVLLALGGSAWGHRRRGMSKGRVIALTACRAVAMLLLVFLAARPTWVSRAPPAANSRAVVLLVDRSESMSVEEGDNTRYQHALTFARERLLPALEAANLPVHAMAFAEDAEPVDGLKLSTILPKGRRTNLGGAIAKAVASAPQPPLAVIALTDGIANESADNARGLSALIDGRVPFIAVGFGSDTGARTLSLRRVDAPTVVSTNTLFRVGAELELVSPEEVAPFDLVLLRDGKVVQKRTVQPGKGSRRWLESFPVSEAEEGLRNYVLQFVPPTATGLKCANTTGTASVTVSGDKEIRVLYVQGALTWDYKFVVLALKDDPAIKLTGLTRTSKQSVFRQNVETAGELEYGFPTRMEELAPFRVVVLSNLTPVDFTPAQQELLARFCSELGGGVLMIGGPATFNAAWQGSRLEQLLPVTFSASQGVLGLDRPFRLRLTEEALQHPVFQVANDRPAREVWAEIPPFTQYGRVDAAKPGAQIWAEHPDDDGPQGKRLLIVSQRFGAGISAILGVQSFWRWRLARNSDAPQFDRFWRQMFRFLSEPTRHEVDLQLADQDFRPQTDIRFYLERRPRATDVPGARQTFKVRVTNDEKQKISEQTVEVVPGRLAESSFRAETASLYTIRVDDAQQREVASRTVEIRDTNVEFEETGRNLETLRQWASLSDGLALAAEDCTDPPALVAQIQRQVERRRHFAPIRQPAGINGWVLGGVLACLGAEWMLRKRWAM